MTEKIRVGIIGLGFMGRIHFQEYGTIDDVVVIAIADTNRSHLSGRWTDESRTSGGDADAEIDLSYVKAYEDADQLIADEMIDAVDICLPTNLHHKFAVEALKKGKHVVVEKPIAQTIKQGREIIEASERYGKILMSAHPLRFWPSYEKLGNSVSDGTLGDVVTASLYRHCATPQWSPDLWNLQEEKGGVLFDMQIHDVDYVVSILGLPRNVISTVSQYQRNQIANTVFSYDGFDVRVESRWIDSAKYPFRSGVHILGREGIAELKSDDSGDELVFYNATGSRQMPLEDADPYKKELTYFIDCVKSNSQPEKCSPNSTLDSLKVVEAAALSARKERPIYLS